MKKDLLASCMATLLGITLCSPCAWAGQTEDAENSTPPPRLSVVGDVNGSEAVQPEREPGAPDEVQAPEEIDDETDRKAAGLAGGDSLPVEAEAKANVSAPQSSAEARSNAASVFDIGDGQPYAGFAEAIAAIPSDAGDVVFNVKSDLYQDYRDYLPGGISFSLPTDRNMTSLTITSDANAQTIVGNGGSDSYCINLFANGVPIIIEAPLKMNALIYGGSNGTPLSGASSITVREGAFARSLFGGSLNADLSGDATILVEGTASTVVGGCRAYASDSGLANASATLRGSSFIDIGEAGGAQKAIGGGIACFPSSGSGALSADAATTGSTSITVNGSIDEVYGGGSAGAASIALSTLSNTAATANVAGSASITFGAKAQTYSSGSMSKMHVYGGGLATGTSKENANRSAADVAGTVTITALEDDTAAQSQPDSKAFSRFYGGGCALYGGAQANVGATVIMTARCGWESAAGIIGGGYVYYNSTDCSAASGSVHTEMGKNATLTGRWVTAAGNVSYNSAGDFHVGSDKGADSVTFTAEEGYAAYVFSNGGYIASDQTAASTARVTGSISSSFENCDIKYFYGGAYLSDTNGNGTIDGNVESRFSKCALPAQDGTMPRAGSGITGDAKLVFADSVLAKGYIGATSASDIGGKHIVSFVGNSTCKDFIYAEHQKGTLLIEIGDEKGTSTQTVVSGVYSPNHIGETDILIHKGATFTPSTISADGSGAPYHLMGVYDLTIEGGGSLVGYNGNPTTLYGNLTGVPASGSEATASITMPASATITGDEASGSALEGVPEVHPTGTLTTGMTLFDFARTGNGKVLLDDPSHPQRYYLAKDETSQQNRTLWTIAAGSTITVKQAEHGTIEPGDNAFNRNEPATYTFVPDYGYRLESILIDGMSAGDVAPGSDRAVSYAFTPSTDTCEVSAVFVPLETEDLHDRIENLPDAADVPTASEETKNAILDAKLDLEAHLEQNPDAPVDADALDKLHEDLLQLPEIQVEVVVEVAGEGGSADEVATIENGCLHHFVYEFGKDEIQALRNGSAELLKIKAVIIDDIVDAEGAERAALDAKLGEEYLLGKHFSVTVTKQTFKSRTDDIPLASEQIHSLGKGITMTFAIPDAVASESGDARTFAIARTHQEDDGSWTASLLPDENAANRASVTVTTDRFSRYAIAYSDVAVPPVDPTPLPAPEEGERKEGGGEDSRAKAKALAKVGDPLPSPVAGTAALAFIACGFALLLRKQAR